MKNTITMIVIIQTDFQPKRILSSFGNLCFTLSKLKTINNKR
ncbi:hypothetical protein [Candidatus Kaistella beijingensis]|nr:hypothetical protein [Candidatus Kaistella beijingensis]